MPEFTFEGAAKWKSGIECDLIIRGKHITTVSPPTRVWRKGGVLCSRGSLCRIFGIMHEHIIPFDRAKF